MFEKEKDKIKNNSHTIENDMFAEFLERIKNELENLESETMINHFLEIKNSIQEEVSKKFENSKHSVKILSIFEKNFEILTNYFIRCQKHNIETKNGIYDLIFDSMMQIKSKYLNLSKLNSNNSNKHGFDEELVGNINCLSGKIRDFNKTSGKCLATLKENNQNIIDQVIFSKSIISDLFSQLNNSIANSVNSKNTGKSQTSTNKEKIIKEKLNSIVERVDSIDEIRTNVNNSIKAFEQNINGFYEESKIIFKRLKEIHTYSNKNHISKKDNVFNSIDLSGYDNLENSRKSNFNKFNSSIDYNSIGNTRKNSSFVNSRSISKGNEIEKDEQRNSRVSSQKRKNNDLFREISGLHEQLKQFKTINDVPKFKVNKNHEINSISSGFNISKEDLSRSLEPEQKKDKNISTSSFVKFDQIDSIKGANENIMSRNVKRQFSEKKLNTGILKENSKTIQTGESIFLKLNNFIVNSPSNTKSDSSINKLAEMVVNFVKQMSNLQEAISNKSLNINELKRNFEANKKTLYDFSCDLLKKKGITKPKQLIPKPSDIINSSNTIKNEINNNSVYEQNSHTQLMPQSGNSKDVNEECELTTTENKIEKPSSVKKPVKKIEKNTELEKIIEENKKEIIDLNTKLDSLNKENENLKSKCLEMSEIERRNKLLEDDNKQFSSDNKEIKNMNELLNDKIFSQTKQNNDILDKLENYKKDIKRNQTLVDQLKLEKKNLEEKTISLENLLQEYQTKINTLNEKISENEKVLKLKNEIEKEVQDLTQVNDSKTKQIKDYESKINILLKEKNELESSLKIVKNNYDEICLKNENNVSLLKSLNQEKESLYTQNQQFINEQNNLRKELSILKKNNEEIETTNKEVFYKINKITAKNNDLEKELSKSSQINESLNSEIKKLEKKLENTMNEYHSRNNILNLENEKLKDLMTKKDQEFKKLEIEANQMSNLLKNSQEKLDQNNQNIIELNNRIDHFEANEYIFKDKLSEYEKEIQRLKKESENDKLNFDNKLSVFSQKIEEELGKSQKLSEEKTNLNQQIIENEEIIKKLNEEVKQLEDKVFQEKNEFTSKINELLDSNKDLEGSNKVLKEELDSCLEQISKIKNNESLNIDESKMKGMDTNKYIDELETENKNLKEKLSNQTKNHSKTKIQLQAVNLFLRSFSETLINLLEFVEYEESNNTLCLGILETIKSEGISIENYESHLASLIKINKDSTNFLIKIITEDKKTIQNIQDTLRSSEWKENELKRILILNIDEMNKNTVIIKKEENLDDLKTLLESTFQSIKTLVSDLTLTNEKLRSEIQNREIELKNYSEEAQNKNSSISEEMKQAMTIQINSKAAKIEELDLKLIESLDQIRKYEEKYKLGENALEILKITFNSNDFFLFKNGENFIWKEKNEITDKIRRKSEFWSDINLDKYLIYLNEIECKVTILSEEVKKAENNLKMEIESNKTDNLERDKNLELTFIQIKKLEENLTVLKGINENLSKEKNEIEIKLKNKEKEYEAIIENLNKTHSNTLSNDNSILSKEYEKTQIFLKEVNEVIIPNLKSELKLKNETVESLSYQNKQLNMQCLELTDKIIELVNKNKEMLVENEKILSNNDDQDKLLKEKSELLSKIDELLNQNKELQKELKAIKNKISDLRAQSQSIIEEKNNEIETLNNDNETIKKENERITEERHKVQKKVKQIIFTFNLLEDTKNISKLSKSFDDDKIIDKNLNNEDNLLKDLDEISRIFEENCRKMNEINKNDFSTSEMKAIEKKIEEINKNTEIRLKDIKEENNNLKKKNEEYSKKIHDAIQDKAPHLLSSFTSGTEINKSNEFFTTMESFKSNNEVLSKINNELEQKLKLAVEKASKYRSQCIDLKNMIEKKSLKSKIDPVNSVIVLEAKLGDLKWSLITTKPKAIEEIEYDDLIWVSAIEIKDLSIEKLKRSTSFDYHNEIENLKIIQEDLITKLTKKEDEYELLKKQVNISTKQEKNHVSLEKYEFLLKQLNDEHQKNNKLNILYEKAKKENEIFKSEIEAPLNKTKNSIEKDQSKFMENEEDINDLFNDNKESEGNANHFEYNHAYSSNKEIAPVKLDEKKINSSFMSEKMNPTNLSINGMLGNSNQNNTTNLDRNSQNFKKSDLNVTKDSIKDNLMRSEEDNKLFMDQLQSIKEELKETRKQRDLYKKQIDKSSTLKDDKNKDLVIVLKHSLEKLIIEINLTNKVKEILNVIMKVIDYTEEQINEIFRRKEMKKGILGGIFGKK